MDVGNMNLLLVFICIYCIYLIKKATFSALLLQSSVRREMMIWSWRNLSYKCSKWLCCYCDNVFHDSL